MRTEKLSSFLRSDMNRLVGEKVDPESIDNLARRIRKELHVSSCLPPSAPGRRSRTCQSGLRRERPPAGSSTSPSPSSSSIRKQGWSGAAEIGTSVANNAFTFGLVSDNDTFPSATPASPRATKTATWAPTGSGSALPSPATTTSGTAPRRICLSQQPFGAADQMPGIYRTRQDFEPAVTFVLAKPLTLTVGAGFQRFETQYPNARFQGSNAMVDFPPFPSPGGGFRCQQTRCGREL